MKIDLLNNSGLISFSDEIAEKMLKAKSFDIATAFITDDAIKLINIFLNNNKIRHRIGRLITGFYHCFNSKEVLIKLRELVKKSNGKLLVNMSNNERFHWKYYHFEIHNNETCYIGSANFTGLGITQNGELVLKLLLNNKDKTEKENFRDIFNKEFENSVDITRIPLEDYQQSKFAKIKSKSLPFSIRNILKSKEKIKPIKKDVKSMYAILLTEHLSAKTIKIIEQKKSNWNDNYYACYGKSDYYSFIRTKLFLVIERYNRRYSFSIAEFVDDCRINTPDGNYFIAYKVKKRISRETENLRNELEELGLNYHSYSFKVKALRSRQTKKLLALFSYKK